MEPELLLRTARELIDEIKYCFAITSGEDGVANARLVQPLKLRDDWSVQFLTNRRCRKVREIEKSGRMTLAYHRESDPSYVCPDRPRQHC